MADNTILSTNVGVGDTIATDDIAGVKYQIVKVSFGALDTATAVTTSTGLPTDPLDRAARDCGKIDIAMGQVAHDAVATAVDPVITGGYASAAAPTAVSLDGDAVRSWHLLNGAQASVLTAAGALIGGDATNGLDVDVTRLPALVAGTAVVGKVGIDQTTPGTTNLVALAANQSVNVAQVNGVTTLMGNGVTGTGSQRVTIASDNTAFSVNATLAAETTKVIGTVNIAAAQAIAATQSGTWTVQPGNTANTTPWLVQTVPGTTGGPSIYHLVSAATTNATNVKASAGQLYGWSVFNTNAAVRYLKLHNTAGTPIAGTGVVYTIGVPAGGGSNINLGAGLAFSTGIGISTVTEGADAGTTAVASGDLIINLHYK